LTEIELAEARFRVGHVLASQLPGLAQELLRGGRDVPALRRLATMDVEEARRDGRTTFERALRELGAGGMNESDAALVIARHFAEQVLEGETTPELAAKGIAFLRWKGGPAVDRQVEPFSRLAERYEQRSTGLIRRAFIGPLDRRVRSEARKLLAG
jgi:hypothetical protein